MHTLRAALFKYQLVGGHNSKPHNLLENAHISLMFKTVAARFVSQHTLSLLVWLEYLVYTAKPLDTCAFYYVP